MRFDILFVLMHFLLHTHPETFEDLYWPEPTNGINGLVKDLGDDEFDVREDANAELKKLGFKALKALKNNFKNDDLETRRRCRKTYDAYFAVSSTSGKTPCSTALPFGKRIKYKDHDGKDAYFKISEQVVRDRYLERFKKANPYNVAAVYHMDDLSCQVTATMCQDMLRWGVPKEVVVKILDDAEVKGMDKDWDWAKNR